MPCLSAKVIIPVLKKKKKSVKGDCFEYMVVVSVNFFKWFLPSLIMLKISKNLAQKDSWF